MKKYNCGIFIGRFTPIHIGHEQLINQALEECEKVVLIVTSKKIDDKNPFDLKLKLDLIARIYENEINSKKLFVESFYETEKVCKESGKKVLKIAESVAKANVDYIIHGSDKDITKFFYEEDILTLHQVVIDRNKIKISSTIIRNYLKKNDKTNLKKYLNPKIYDYISILKKSI